MATGLTRDRRKHPMTWAWAAVIVSASLALTACEGDDKDGANTEPAATGGASTPTPTVSPAPTVSPVDPAKFSATAPGTQLRLGQSAVIPFDSDLPGAPAVQGNLQVTVLAIEKGSIDHLTQSGIKVSDLAAGTTPYYVRVKYRNVSSADMTHTHPDIELSGLDADGRSIGGAMIFGRFGMCEAPETKGFVSGAEVEGCELYLAAPGAAVTSVTYDFPDAQLDPVVWKP